AWGKWPTRSASRRPTRGAGGPLPRKWPTRSASRRPTRGASGPPSPGGCTYLEAITAVHAADPALAGKGADGTQARPQGPDLAPPQRAQAAELRADGPGGAELAELTPDRPEGAELRAQLSAERA